MVLAEQLASSWRLEQIFNLTFDTLNAGAANIDRKKIGEYLKAVNQDIIKEEAQTIVEAGYNFKELAGYISKISKDYFFQMEKEMLV